jgi:uroporphyrinogen III methyltransferase/synthase
LGTVAERLAGPPPMRPPVVVIVGDVVHHAAAATWFETRPLFGVRVLVARPEEQAASLCDPLLEWGADVVIQPAIAISDPPDWTAVDDALARIASFDYLVFSSANGVRYLLDRLLARGQDMRALSGVKLAAIGPGTTDALAQYHLRTDVAPDEYRAEALAEVLSGDARGKRLLLARASRGREVLAEQLTAAGGDVEQIVVYSSTDVTAPDEDLAQLMQEGQVHWVAVTSSAIARSLAALFGPALHNAKLASISPVTSATLRELGFEPAAEAREYTMAGVVDAIVAGAAGFPPSRQ